MRYAHVLSALTEERWALREHKLVAIVDFLRAQANGEKLSADELQARIAPQTAAAVARREGAVAVLPLRGVIANRVNLMSDISGGTSAEGFGALFQAALRDDGVKAIVMDVDSPGGAVSGAEELSAMIFAARGRKPIIAHVNATAASAAYWIASAADEIVAVPTGTVGSIGVYGVHNDVSKALDAEGIRTTIVSAGRLKAAGHPSQPLDDETRTRMQTRIDAAYDMFVAAVARNRAVSAGAVRGGFGEGDIVDAGPALAEGMIDRIGTLDETLQRFGASLYGGAPAARSGAFPRERAKRALALT